MLGARLGLKVELRECEKIRVCGDRHRLRQVLLNLVDNAVKYNEPNGSVTLELRRDGEEAHITLTNTGPGIPPEQLPRVFDRFYRDDAAGRTRADGCGLGLSIAQWIVTAHGGTISITSEMGRHTTVTVRLPGVNPAGMLVARMANAPEGAVHLLLVKAMGEFIQVRHEQDFDACFQPSTDDLPGNLGALPFVRRGEGLVEQQHRIRRQCVDDVAHPAELFIEFPAFHAGVYFTLAVRE